MGFVRVTVNQISIMAIWVDCWEYRFIERRTMATSNIKATFSCDLKKVWNIETSLENYSWRSDLSKIEVLSESKFVE